MKALVLDMGGVLCRDAIRPKIRDLSSRYDLNPTDLERTARRLRPSVDVGELPEADFWSELLSDHGTRASETDLSVEEYAVPLDGALPFLDWAENQTFELAILSNDSADLFRARIRALGSTRNFTVCVVSALARYAKPDPAVYQLLLGRLGVSAPDCLFVDDRDENVRAARELGMGARVFTGFEALRASLGSTVAGDHKS